MEGLRVLDEEISKFERLINQLAFFEGLDFNYRNAKCGGQLRIFTNRGGDPKNRARTGEIFMQIFHLLS